MYFDLRLWGFTRGVRLRILGAVALGVLGVLFGIARLALLGWLIAEVFSGTGFSELVVAGAFQPAGRGRKRHADRMGAAIETDLVHRAGLCGD